MCVESDFIEIESRTVSNGQTHLIKKRLVPECNKGAPFALVESMFQEFEVVILPDPVYHQLEKLVSSDPLEFAGMVGASPVLKSSRNTGVYIEA